MPTPASGSSLQKAYIILVEPPNQSTTIPKLQGITRRQNVGKIDFMFNPASYTMTKSANWSRGAIEGAKTTSMPQFGGTGPASMSLEILIDHSHQDTPQVAKQVDDLLKGVLPTPKSLDRGKPCPPWAVFGWGNRIPMVGYISQVSATYTLFRPDGAPVRARCTVSLEELPTDPMTRQNPTSGSDRVTRQHVVVAGDSLPSIALHAYGDTRRWRDVAEVNGIDDPMRLVAGDRLLLPHAADLDDGL